MKSKLFYISGILLLIFFWSVLSFVFTTDIIPAPFSVFKNILFLLKDKFFLFNLLMTFVRSILGFLSALALGFIIGVLTGSIKAFEKSLFVPVMLLQGAPTVLWVIPLVLIIGVNGLSAGAFVFLIALPLVILNIQEGTKAIGRSQKEMFKVYADKKLLKFFYLLLPSLSAYLKSVFILGVVLSLKSSVLGEWFAAKNGVGRVINEYFYTFDMLSFYSVSVVYIMLIAGAAFGVQKISGTLFARKRTLKEPDFYFKIIEPEKKSSFLKMEHLSFSYADKIILNDINFKLNKPENIILTGESGAGKTTFAKIAFGLVKPVSGNIAKPENGTLIFQDDIFVDNIDVLSNAKLPALFKKDKNPRARAFYYLEKCGLKDCYNYFPDELSGGMKKRLSFARSLVFNPSFVILDEPFVNLHKDAREELWDLYFELFSERKIPSIIITHYPEELSERNLTVYELKDGKILKKS